MAHPTPRWGGTTSDETDDGLLVWAHVVLCEVLCSVFLHGTADLTDENDALGARVGEEDLDDVDVLRAGEGVTADTDGQGLAEACEGGLAEDEVSGTNWWCEDNPLNGLVCQTTSISWTLKRRVNT
jgi:hypothetical protein